MHQLTNYKAIKNKSNKTGQYRTQNLYQTYTAQCKLCTLNSEYKRDMMI